MLKKYVTVLCILCAFFLCGAEPIWKNLPDGGAGRKIFYLPQFSEFKEISDQDMLFFKKVLSRAADENALAIIMELDTPGGSIETALKYISLFAKNDIPLIVYLNPQGISAGMIIALGADRIAINPLGVIGDAMPVQQLGTEIRPIINPEPVQTSENKNRSDKKDPPEKDKKSLIEDIIQELEKQKSNSSGSNKELADQKFLTVFFKIMQMLAEKNNRPVKVIRAACDPFTELNKNADGIAHKKGSPLTLSASEALQLGVVDYIVKDKNEIPSLIGAPRAQIVEIKKNAIEEIISFLSHPVLAGLLLTLGLIGIFIEIRTPGFGLAGTAGIFLTVLFFLGHVASGASEWGPMVIFFVGLILILLEIFLIPGFGLVGITGGACVIFSLISAFGAGNFQLGLKVVVLSMLAVLIICILLYMYILPKSRFFGRFILDKSISAPTAETDTVNTVAIGTVGEAVTPLKPTGKVKFNGTIFEGRSFDGSLIKENTQVKAVATTSFEITVSACIPEENS